MKREMALWNWFFGRPKAGAPVRRDGASAGKEPIRLPSEPLVFECRDCGKVFEIRRLHPSCPECDSDDVELMS